MLIIIMAMIMSGCGFMSDKAIEMKLDGKWRCCEKTHEDGITMKVVETIAYDAINHEFESELKMRMTSPIAMHIGTVTYSGSWCATTQKLMGKIDKNSIRFSFNRLLDHSDREDMKKMMMNGIREYDYLDGGIIISISDDTFELRDEDDNSIYKYSRVKDE